MAAKASWHRYGTKLRHCRPMYSCNVEQNRINCWKSRGGEGHMLQFPIAGDASDSAQRVGCAEVNGGRSLCANCKCDRRRSLSDGHIMQ